MTDIIAYLIYTPVQSDCRICGHRIKTSHCFRLDMPDGRYTLTTNYHLMCAEVFSNCIAHVIKSKMGEMIADDPDNLPERRLPAEIIGLPAELIKGGE